jgi:hypothetical protein
VPTFLRTTGVRVGATSATVARNPPEHQRRQGPQQALHAHHPRADAGRGPLVNGMPVDLQSRLAKASVWRKVASGRIESRGVRAWSVRQNKATYYRVLSGGTGADFDSTSVPRLVKKALIRGRHRWARRTRVGRARRV